MSFEHQNYLESTNYSIMFSTIIIITQKLVKKKGTNLKRKNERKNNKERKQRMKECNCKTNSNGKRIFAIRITFTFWITTNVGDKAGATFALI